MRKSASVRLGILLAVSALLSCEGERAPERRCVDGEGRFADDSLCAQEGGAARPDGGLSAEATGSWDPAGDAGRARGGYHFVWIPYGAFGGVGTFAPGYQRGGAPAAPGAASGAATSGSVSRGGFGATGAAHAGASGGGHAAVAAGS